MRILAVLRGNEIDREVLASVRHLVTPDRDEVHLLIVRPHAAVHEVVSTVGGVPVQDAITVGTDSGMAIPTLRVRPRPAESVEQSLQREIAEQLAYLDEMARVSLDTVPHVSHVRVNDDAVYAVLDVASEVRAHGIAVGALPLPWLHSPFTHDLADEVLSRASVPVLVLRPSVHVPRMETSAGNGR